MGALLAFIVSLEVLTMVSGLEHPVTSAELREQNMSVSLESELSLAKEKAVYVVCDPGGGEIDIKARGMTLKSLPVTSYKLFGQAPPARPLKLLRKDALAEPRRERIKPKAEGEDEGEDAAKSTTAFDSYDVKALEVHDMPASFSIYLDEGVTIHIAPVPETFKGRLAAVIAGAERGLTRPVVRLWHALRKAPHSEVEISLSEADARALYWHLAEGAKLLVRDSGESESASP